MPALIICSLQDGCLKSPRIGNTAKHFESRFAEINMNERALLDKKAYQKAIRGLNTAFQLTRICESGAIYIFSTHEAIDVQGLHSNL